MNFVKLVLLGGTLTMTRMNHRAAGRNEIILAFLSFFFVRLNADMSPSWSRRSSGSAGT